MSVHIASGHKCYSIVFDRRDCLTAGRGFRTALDRDCQQVDRNDYWSGHNQIDYCYCIHRIAKQPLSANRSSEAKYTNLAKTECDPFVEGEGQLTAMLSTWTGGIP